MRRALTLAAFIAFVVGGGTLIGFATAPGEWYAALAKPWFNPPNWVFAPVWSILYVLIAVSGWRTFEGAEIGAFRAWLAQITLNFLWSPVFFGARLPGTALVVIVALLAAILIFMVLAWRRDRVAALLFAPYAAWVAFAALLNGAIWNLN